MTEHDRSEHDDAKAIDEALLCTAPAANPELCTRLLERTKRVIRRRRHARRLRLAALMAACYLAGIATVASWPPSGDAAPRPAATAPPAAAQPPPEQEPPVPAPPARPKLAPVPTPAPVLERWALLADAEHRAELFRKAGDRHLEAGHWEAALRCYRRSLEAAPAGPPPGAEPDNWLFLALKVAKERERQNERHLD